MSDDIHILVIEDDDDLRDNVASVLEYEGFKVVAVGSGMEAVEAARGQVFDLVVADIRMKGISGLDALEQVRDRQPEVRSLVVTGYSTEADSIRAIRLGVGEYLKKPFDLETFLEAVRRLVAQRREQQRTRAREDAMHRATLLALEALARSLDASDGLIGASRLAARLASEVGVAVQDVQLATLVSGLHRLHPESQPGLLIEALSPSVRRTFQETMQLWDSVHDGVEGTAVSLEASVAALCQVSPDMRRFFAPTLVQALERVAADERPAGARAASSEMEAGRRRRGLLILGRALEGGGEIEEARRAYRDVLEDGGTHREGAEALLGLGRLARSAGDAAAARKMAAHAQAVGAQLGPASAGESSLEAGVLLALLGDKAAVDALSSAAATLDNLHLPAAAARARLALACLCGGDISHVDAALSVLLRPEHLDELSHALWLLPWLLQRPAPSEVQARASRRLVRDFPTEVARLLDGLSADGRLAAARGLAASSGARAQSLLQRLASDADARVRSEAAAALQQRGVSAQKVPVLRIHSLGPFEVYRGEERVGEKEWQGRNVRHLLAYVAQAGRPVPVDVLIDQFWPEHFETGRKNLNWAVSILRKCLRSTDDQDYILRTGQSLQLNPSMPHWHDVTELSRELESLRSEESAGRVETAMGHARRALQIYRGPYLEDCYLDWALDARNQTELRVLDAARTLARMASGLGAHMEALEAARRLLDLDPLDADAWLLLMQSNIALGRAEEAARQYESYRKTMKAELGVEPSIDMMREHQRALIALSTPPEVRG